ncbi:hypothetical protein ACJX0J_024121, partial [Zea mays]
MDLVFGDFRELSKYGIKNYVIEMIWNKKSVPACVRMFRFLFVDAGKNKENILGEINMIVKYILLQNWNQKFAVLEIQIICLLKIPYDIPE